MKIINCFFLRLIFLLLLTSYIYSLIDNCSSEEDKYCTVCQKGYGLNFDFKICQSN